MQFTTGNTTGRFFQGESFDELKKLAHELAKHIPVENPHLHYDSEEDFHWLAFTSEGLAIRVRHYKVFGIFLGDRRIATTTTVEGAVGVIVEGMNS